MKWKWTRYDIESRECDDPQGSIYIEWRSWQRGWRKSWATWIIGPNIGSSWPTGGSGMSRCDENPVLDAVHQARHQLIEGNEV